MAFHWRGVCGLGTKFDTLATTVGARPVTSRPRRAIVSAMSRIPSRSAGPSPGSPHMKYSLTRWNPFWNARRQPSYRSSLRIDLPIWRRISSRAASGASVRPECRSVVNTAPMARSCSLTRRLGTEMLTSNGRSAACKATISSSKCG